jgi:tRNA(fMet)-specific endonuclease VapC
MSATIRTRQSNSLVRALSGVEERDQVTTAITVAELLLGVARDTNEERRDRVRTLASWLPAIPFDRAAAEAYGPLRHALESTGRRLDERDLMIASICLARDLTLVTGNVRHFSRVPGLHVENWLEG